MSQSRILSNFRESLRIVSSKSHKTSTSFVSNPGYKSFSNWLDWLLTTLKNIGWPGPRVPNTYEYQQLQSFFNAIEVLRSLDQCQVDPAPSNNTLNRGQHYHAPQTPIKVSLSSFVHQLTTACTNMVFHMQTKDTKVSVLGLMEASALPFDFCSCL